jgi:hypothetical protein
MSKLVKLLFITPFFLSNTIQPYVLIREFVKNGIITILEGNYKDGCNVRTKEVDARYIRGYICPKYDEIAKSIRNRLIVAGFIDVPRGVYFDEALEWAKKNDVVYGIDEYHFGPHLSTTRGQMITLLYRLYGNNVDVDITIPFTDVDPRGFYYKALKWGYKNNIVKGITDNEFDPHAACKRAEVVAMLYRLAGSVEPNMVYSTFDDVPADSWYNDAVVWAHENGIVKGVSETEFAPDNNITREQIAAIMHRYATFKGYDVSVGENTNILSYDDFDSISEYAIASIQWACGSGLIEGRTESTLNPKENATRAEIAAILHRFLEANK